MDPEQRAAYVNAQAACCMAEALGMISENMMRISEGKSVAYDHSAFCSLIERYGVHHNAVVMMLRGDV